MNTDMINGYLADPVTARMLEALCEQCPGGITRLAEDDPQQYTFCFGADEVVFSRRQRDELEQALGVRLLETQYPGYAGEIALAVNAAVRSQLLGLIEASRLPASLPYGQMSDSQKKAFDDHHGIGPGDRERVAQALERIEQQSAATAAQIAAIGPKYLQQSAGARNAQARRGVVVGINAMSIVALDDLEEELDKVVPGVYLIELEDPVPREKLASVALDVFHSRVAVDALDQFEFTAFDPATGIVMVEDPNHESYSGLGTRASLAKECDEPLSIFEVRVSAVGGPGPAVHLGDVHVAAADEAEATSQASAKLWDARLEATGFSHAFDILSTASPAREEAPLDLHVTLKVSYRLNGCLAEEVRRGLERRIERAIQNGMISDEDGADVDEYSFSVEQGPAHGPFAAVEESLAVISTAHLTPGTFERLSELPVISYGNPAAEGGVFIYVGEPHESNEGWPDDLAILIARAREHGLVWVKVDPDAEVLQDLPTYHGEWEGVHDAGGGKRQLGERG